MEQTQKTLQLVASTFEAYSCSIAESQKQEDTLSNGLCSQATELDGDHDQESNYFKSAQWTSDGTSIITSNADNTTRTFIIPPNLLSCAEPINLTPYTRHKNPAPVSCVRIYPLFDLSSPSTTLYLSTPSGFPIRLLNTLSPTPEILSTYHLTSETTESYLTSASIDYPSSTQFYAGTDCLIALFDLSCNGSGPLVRLPTIPSKRHRMKGGGVGMRGIVSALDSQTDHNGILAAGTWTRCVSLYDAGGLGGTVATWSIAEAADKVARIGGNGVSEVIWSRCGRYLCVVERMSDGILVFDVRVSGNLLAWLKGRKANTNQRLGVDLFQAGSGIEVWTGGTDGIVRVWENVGTKSGALERDWEWRAHEDHVTSAIVHPSGTVVATCSGQKSFPVLDKYCEDESESDKSTRNITSSSQKTYQGPDNCLKVWSL